jgi:hypothetical protein
LETGFTILEEKAIVTKNTEALPRKIKLAKLYDSYPRNDLLTGHKSAFNRKEIENTAQSPSLIAVSFPIPAPSMILPTSVIIHLRPV